MYSTLDPNNILFYLRTGCDISLLLAHQGSSADFASKKSSLDCKKLIALAFAPQVPVTCSGEVDLIAESFGFHSFFHLLRPFGEHIQHKFQIKDSQLISRTTDEFSLRFTRPLDDILSIQEAESTGKSQLLSHQSLELLMEEYIKKVNTEILKQDDSPDSEVIVSLLKRSIYAKYFSKFLSSSIISPFEYMNHPISTLIFISAKETYDDARKLLIRFKSTAVPEYLSIDDILPIFIVVYDQADTKQQQNGVQLRDHIKKQLYVDAFLLSIVAQNSSLSKTPSPLQLLSVDEELNEMQFSSDDSLTLPVENAEGISGLLKELIQKKIIPFMEQKIATWDEQVITPRKSLTGRFFNVSKRYFGGSSTKNQTTTEKPGNFNSERGYYTNQSTEAITRKLGDWSFMLRDYKYAYTTYELSKKDFLSDKAWNYLASTQEMAAISLLMGATNITSKLKNDTIDPLLDSTNYTYLARCGLKTYALRSILIVSELFCTLRDGWQSAPAALNWLRKAIEDKLVGRIGKSILLQRTGYVYSLYVSTQAKVIIGKQDIDQAPQEDTEENEHGHIPEKIELPKMAIIGLTRNRKAALWNLLAAQDWNPESHPLQVKLCLNEAKTVYTDLSFVNRESSLMHRLTTASNSYLETSS